MKGIKRNSFTSKSRIAKLSSEHVALDRFMTRHDMKTLDINISHKFTNKDERKFIEITNIMKSHHIQYTLYSRNAKERNQIPIARKNGPILALETYVYLETLLRRVRDIVISDRFYFSKRMVNILLNEITTFHSEATNEIIDCEPYNPEPFFAETANKIEECMSLIREIAENPNTSAIKTYKFVFFDALQLVSLCDYLYYPLDSWAYKMELKEGGVINSGAPDDLIKSLQERGEEGFNFLRSLGFKDKDFDDLRGLRFSVVLNKLQKMIDESDSLLMGLKSYDEEMKSEKSDLFILDKALDFYSQLLSHVYNTSMEGNIVEYNAEIDLFDEALNKIELYPSMKVPPFKVNQHFENVSKSARSIFRLITKYEEEFKKSDDFLGNEENRQIFWDILVALERMIDELFSLRNLGLTLGNLKYEDIISIGEVILNTIHWKSVSEDYEIGGKDEN